MIKFNNELDVLCQLLYNTVVDSKHNKVVSFSYNNCLKAVYLTK